MAVESANQEMARRRAMLTDTERELLDGDEKSDRYYQAVSRVRRKINEELTDDVELLKENHPDLLEELREVVCEDFESRTPICPDCMYKVSVSNSKSSDYFCPECHAELSKNDILFEEDVETPE